MASYINKQGGGGGDLQITESGNRDHPELDSHEEHSHKRQTCSWQNECSGRFPVKAGAASEDRMVSIPRHTQESLQTDQDSMGRSFCNKMEHKASTVPIPNTGQRGMGDRRTLLELEGNMGIYISLDSGDAKQSDLRSMPGPIYSTSITRGNVASGNTVTTRSNSHKTASNKNSAKAAKESSFPSKATIPKTSRLEVIRRTIKLEHILSFADDTTVFLSDNEPTRLFNRANESMNAIFNWFCANRLSLNASKTHYMVINPPHKNLDLSAHSLTIDNVILSKVTSCKFLGITLDESLVMEETTV